MNASQTAEAQPTSAAPRLSLIARLAVLGILGSTLPFKFSGAPESVALFEKLGAEPFGRYGLASIELIAVLLLLPRATRAIGSALALGLMSGALVTHLTILGIEVDGDGGSLFGMAVAGFVGAAIATFLHRRELPIVGDRL